MLHTLERPPLQSNGNKAVESTPLPRHPLNWFRSTGRRQRQGRPRSTPLTQTRPGPPTTNVKGMFKSSRNTNKASIRGVESDDEQEAGQHELISRIQEHQYWDESLLTLPPEDISRKNLR